MKLFSGLVLVLMILSSAVYPNAIVPESISPAGMIYSTSIAVNALNNPVIAFCEDDALKLATWDGSSWSIEEIVPGGNIGYCTLDYDNDGYPRIAYWNNSDYSIHCIAWYDNYWNDAVVHDGDIAMAGPECCVCVTSQGEPLIAFLTQSLDMPLILAAEFGSGWSRTAINTELSRGLSVSMDLGPDDIPQLVCFGQISKDLIYDTVENDAWISQTVDSEGVVGYGADIAVDSRNLPHISYMDRTIGAVKYAFFDGEEWQISTIVTTGDPTGMIATSIELDSNDLPRILFSDLVGDQVELAIYDGNSWTIESVDSRGHSISMTIDSDDNLHMSYYRHSYSAQELKYAIYMP